MSKKQETIGTAYDITYNHKKRIYELIKVEYNASQVVEKTSAGDSRMFAVLNAKKAIVDKVLALNMEQPIEEKSDEK